MAKLPKVKMPEHIQPMLSTLVGEPFDADGWLFEIKWDGFRALAFVQNKDVQLNSRNEKSFNLRFPQIIDELKKLNVQTILDGEIVILDKEGKPSFQLMQNYQTNQTGVVAYYVFDILFLNDRDLKHLPLIERKEILKQLLVPISSNLIRYCDHVETKGIEFYKHAKKLFLEGIIAKNAQSIYEMKRSKNWLKIKTHLSQEVVIGGFTEPRGSRKNMGALLVGVYKNNQLTYAGHVGGGFTQKLLADIHKQLVPLIQDKSPFEKKIKAHSPVTWVAPKLLCEVSFTEWTSEGIMRQPIFKGMRFDKKPKEVKKEIPMLPEKIINNAHQKKGKEIKTKHSQNDEQNIDIHGHTLTLTNLNKIFWKNENYTKGDLIHYYEEMAAYILPYLKDKPLVLHRFPHGSEGMSFYQKNMPENQPEWIQHVHVMHENRQVNYLMVQDLETLLYVANLGCIEMHPFHSKINRLDFPDYLIFDLDPEKIDFKFVIQTAKMVYQVLKDLNVISYCKTSGGRGLHIYVPLAGKYTNEQARQFAELIARVVHNKLPDLTSLERMPKNRQGKVYIDFLQNGLGKTVAAPYSLRPKPGATVSTPLDWDELNHDLTPLQFNIGTISKRVKEVHDLFRPILGKGANLEKALKLLKKS